MVPEFVIVVLIFPIFVHQFQGVLDNIIRTPMPDGSPYYHDLLGATEKIFQELYSGEEFFPKSTSSEEGAAQELED
uniref:Rab escort protein n=1 Tax=Solanum tuberosum TaxID=4113 RepID=M0ZMF3_SOLTU